MPITPQDQPSETEHIGIRLPRTEREAIDAYARAHDLTRSQVVRRAIRLLLNQSKGHQ